MVTRLSNKIHEGPIAGGGTGCTCLFLELLTSSVFWRLGRGVVTPTKPFAIHMLVYATMAPNGLDLGFRD